MSTGQTDVQESASACCIYFIVCNLLFLFARQFYYYFTITVLLPYVAVPYSVHILGANTCLSIPHSVYPSPLRNPKLGFIVIAINPASYFGVPYYYLLSKNFAALAVISATYDYYNTIIILLP